MDNNEIPTEVLKRDIEITKTELHCYQILEEGYTKLANLPEVTSSDRRLYSFRSKENQLKRLECKKFLDTLEDKLKKREEQND